MGVQVPPPAFFINPLQRLALIITCILSLSWFAGCAPRIDKEAKWEGLPWGEWLKKRELDHQKFKKFNGKAIRDFSEKLKPKLEEEDSSLVKLKDGYLFLERAKDETLPRLIFLTKDGKPVGDPVTFDKEKTGSNDTLDLLRINDAEDRIASVIKGDTTRLCIANRTPVSLSCIDVPGIHDVSWGSDNELLYTAIDEDGLWKVKRFDFEQRTETPLIELKDPSETALFRKVESHLLLEMLKGESKRYFLFEKKNFSPLPKEVIGFASANNGSLKLLEKNNERISITDSVGTFVNLTLPKTLEVQELSISQAGTYLLKGLRDCSRELYECISDGTCRLITKDAPTILIPSTDNTLVPLREHTAAKERAVILRFYGAYGIPLPPLTDGLQQFIEKGVSIVDVGVRGGGECGAEWAKSASGPNRKKSLEDLTAAIQVISSRKKVPLFLLTRSAGSFVGAIAASQQRSVIKGAIFEAPFVSLKDWMNSKDAVRERDEWGDVHNQLTVHALLQLQSQIYGSPIPIYVWLGGLDEQVPIEWVRPWLDSASAPVIANIDRTAHHDGPSNLSDTLELYAEEYAFLSSVLDGSYERSVHFIKNEPMLE